MSLYILGLVIVLVVFSVPSFRRAALSLLGLSAIAAVAITGIGLPVWGLYEAKSWLIADEVDTTDVSSLTPEGDAVELEAVLDKEAASAAREVEQLRLEEERKSKEQRLLDEEQRRIAGVAENARSIVAMDWEYAQIAATSPQIPGIDQVSADLIVIRIPRWRDSELADREMGLIRAWLHSIGLTPQETAHIYTAKGWGAVYELWRQENPIAVSGLSTPMQSKAQFATNQPAFAEPESEVGQAEPESKQAERSAVAQPRVTEPKPEPRRAVSIPRSSAARRQPLPARPVGPFGY